MKGFMQSLASTELKHRISFLITLCLMLLLCNQVKSQSTVSLPLSNGIKVWKYTVPGAGVVDYSYYLDSSNVDSSTIALEQFDKNGKPIYWQTFIPRFQENGLYVSWYPNGQINSISNYIKGQRIGIYIEYYDNGQLKEKGSYWIEQHGDTMIFNEPKIDTVSDSHPGYMRVVVSSGKDLKDGDWVYYSEKGVMIRKEKYFHGKLIATYNYSNK